MKFTYEEYKQLLENFVKEGYSFELYKEKVNYSKSVICRHDLDMSLQMSLPIAEIELRLGIKGVYFVLVSTNFYNIFSKESREVLKKIEDMGHVIGLHFDASIYNYNTDEQLESFITKEQSILENLLCHKVSFVSFHRPIKSLFNKTLNNGMISAYEKKYFTNYEYVSDSRRNWKKDPNDVIKLKKKHIQLLTHPFWYSNNEITMRQSVQRLECEITNSINNSLLNNITDYKQLI